MRDKNEFIGMSKSSIISQLRSLKDSILHGPPHYKMDDFVEENLLSWILKNVGHLGNTHYKPYPSYKKGNGIFRITKPEDAPVSIALLSDWASDTPESHHIAAQVGDNDYSIHLGDTYYVGNEKEIGYNFNRKNGTWPYGSMGSFAMLGNHEMYSSGKSYFESLLPWMGSYNGGNDKPVQQQEASYFCLENKYWRVIALDTGYYSLKGWLGLKPNTGMELHADQVAWLRNIVKPDADKRGIIILSHHQSFSAFEKDEFPKPGETVASLLGAERSVIWLWGHEHWSSVYGANAMSNGGEIFARCIGNSGMPVELNVKKKPKAPRNPNRNLVLFDNRERETVNGNIPLGHNGYVILTLQGAQLTISSYDDNNLEAGPRKILEEQWTVDITTGALTGRSIEDYTATAEYPLCRVGPLEDAIRSRKG